MPNFPSRRSLRDAERANGKTAARKPASVPPVPAAPAPVTPLPADASVPVRRRDARLARNAWTASTVRHSGAAAPAEALPGTAASDVPLRVPASRVHPAGSAAAATSAVPAPADGSGATAASAASGSAGAASTGATSAGPAADPASATPAAAGPAPGLSFPGISAPGVHGADKAATPASANAVATKQTRASKAGRNLPAAIAVGVGMLATVLGGLLIYPVALVAIVSVFAVIGVWEVSRALVQRNIALPVVPAIVGALAMPSAAYFAGAEGLLFAMVASAVAVLVWRCLDPEEGAIQSIFAGVFALAWIPFMISFVFLLLRRDGTATGITWLGGPHLGALQVGLMLLLVVANDTFGYLIGSLFGKHPMAPKISPKKSWEGFAGSMGGAVVVAVLATVFLLHQPWWVGLVLAAGMVSAATAGDLAESMVKRELGVKDMSSILPGHGGMMDRLDSILFASPVAFLLFTVLAPFQG